MKVCEQCSLRHCVYRSGEMSLSSRASPSGAPRLLGEVPQHGACHHSVLVSTSLNILFFYRFEQHALAVFAARELAVEVAKIQFIWIVMAVTGGNDQTQWHIELVLANGTDELIWSMIGGSPGVRVNEDQDVAIFLASASHSKRCSFKDVAPCSQMMTTSGGGRSDV